MQSINIMPTASLVMNKYESVMRGDIRLHYRHRNTASLVIEDLSNAHLRGEETVRYHIEQDYDAPDCALLNWEWMNRTPESLLNYLHSTDIDMHQVNAHRLNDYLKVYKGTTRGVNSWNPNRLDRIKPLKSRPKKWSIPNVIRALVNKQGHLHLDERLTDDYAWDAATNFGRGDYDPHALAEDLVTTPSGYRAWIRDSDNNALVIACHHFLYYTFTLKGL